MKVTDRQGRPVKAIEHVAGPMIGLVQRCVRCDFVLNDYRNVSYERDAGPPTGWREGDAVGVAGAVSFVRDPSQPPEEPCRARVLN